MTARYISTHRKADWTIHLSKIDSRHPTPATGDYIIGDFWTRDDLARLEPCNDWDRARFRYHATPDWQDGPQIATNVEITGSNAWPNQDDHRGFWMRCKIIHPGDAEPDHSYPGWVLCLGRDN